jgi:hypothetical protein
VEVSDVIGALGVRVDARDWDGVWALFSQEVRVDYTSLFGGEPEVLSPADLMERWRRMIPGFTHTTHLIAQPHVVVEYDRASASASVVAWHFIDDPSLGANDHWIVGGCYLFELVQAGGNWRITSLTLARAWARGNLDLPRLATERAGLSSAKTG